MKEGPFTQNLIKILDKTLIQTVEDFCHSVRSSTYPCNGIKCEECPFCNTDNLKQLIDELKTEE